MKTPAWRLIMTVALALGACGPAPPESDRAEAEQLNFYNWSDYIADGLLEEFAAETGIQVTYDVFDSNEVLEGKLLAGSSGYDLVVPTGSFFQIQRDAGLFRELDRSLLPNHRFLDPGIMAEVGKLDPGNRFAVPYMWGTVGLGVDVARITERMPDAPLDSWALLLDPENAARFADCGIAVLDASADIADITLNYLGLDPHTADPQELERGFALIAAIRPHIRYFHSSQYIDDLANGEICLALGWSGDIYQAIDDAAEGVDLRYVLPREGTVIYFDLFAIPADAPHPEAAHAMIDFLMRPEVAGRNSNAIFYANPIPASRPFLEPGIRDDPAIYPPAEAMARLFPDRAAPPEVRRLRNRIWTRVKSGR